MTKHLILLYFCVGIIIVSALPTKSFSSFTATFTMFQTSMNYGYMKGNIVYSWNDAAYKLTFTSQNWVETYIFNSQNGENGTTSQSLYKSGSPSCGCESAGIPYSQPRLFVDTGVPIWQATGSIVDGCTQYESLMPLSPLESVWVIDATGVLCRATFNQVGLGRDFFFMDFVSDGNLENEFGVPAGCLCYSALDIVLALDRSGSITFTEFISERNFTNNFGIGFSYMNPTSPSSSNNMRTQLSIVNFNNVAWTYLTLGSGNTLSNVNISIQALTCCPYLGTNFDPNVDSCCIGFTSISSALRLAADNLALSTRSYSSKVIVVVTDGYHNLPWYSPEMTQPPTDCYHECSAEYDDATLAFYYCMINSGAERVMCLDDLRAGLAYAQQTVPGLTVYTVGVGETFLIVRPEEFDIMTSNNTNHQFSVGQWSLADSIIEDLLNQICQQNVSTCGTGCCGFCACRTCFPPDGCQSPSFCTDSTLVGTCCKSSPHVCPNDDPCTTTQCLNNSCVTTPLPCPSQNLCYNYVCVQGSCVEIFLGKPDNACVIATCNKPTTSPSTWNIKQVPKCPLGSDPCYLYNCINGSCITTPIPPPLDPNRCASYICNSSASGTFTRTLRTCVAGLCQSASCDPQSGVCEVQKIDCRTDPKNLCDLSTCNNMTGNCIPIWKNCTEPENGNLCRLPTGVCDSTTGLCDYYTKVCPPSSCEDTYCNTTTGNCMNTYSPRCDTAVCNKTNCSILSNTCELRQCLTDETTPNCDGITFLNSTCITENSNRCEKFTQCDPSVLGGCVYTDVTCPNNTSTPCTTYIKDPTYPGCCRVVPTTCGNNPCLNYTCDPDTNQCHSVSTCPANDACTQWTCDQGTCVKTTINCTALTPCMTVVGCDPVVGCSYTPVVCEAVPCTTSHCDMESGECMYTTSVCNDSTDPCVVETCVSTNSECAITRKTCDDGNACTEDYCDNFDGDCVNVPINMSVCDDNNLCTNDTCDPKIGCVHVMIMCSGLNCTNYTCNPSEGCPIACIIPYSPCVTVCNDPESACTSVCPNSDTVSTEADAPYILGLGAILAIAIGSAIIVGGVAIKAVAIASSNTSPFSVTTNPLYQGNQHPSNPLYSPKSKTGADGL